MHKELSLAMSHYFSLVIALSLQFPYFYYFTEFVLTPQDTEVDAGTTLLWDCTAKGTPTPVLTWAKDGVKFQSDTPEHISILSNSSLVITGVKPEDAGKYQCHARNGVAAHVVQATLTVRGETLWYFLVLVPSMFECY